MSGFVYQFYREQLTDREKQAYDRVLSGWSRYQDSVLLPEYRIGSRELERVGEIGGAVANDHPELFWMNYYNMEMVTTLMGTRLKAGLFQDPVQAERLHQETLRWQQKICRQLAGFGRDAMLWLIFDYLARQVTYGEQSTAQSHTILGPYTPGNHVAVCEGIAKAFKFLCDGASIPCIVVSGEADNGRVRGPHAWNIVWSESGPRHLDVTWELWKARLWGKATRRNFMKRDREMRAYQWDRSAVPRCD